MPSRTLVLTYLATAHVSLALAFGLVAWNPYAVAGFFYHSWIVAIVHLITIGWIAMSILGSVYVVLPMACGVAFPVRKLDYTAYAFVAIGLIGMVAHFWIAEFGGMAWSAMSAASGIGFVMVRFAWNLRTAGIAGGVKLHLYFAAANALLATWFGVVLGFDKVHHFLPGYVLSNVFAHAHLVAVGWVLMMAVGFGYRLLPMMLSAAPPSGRAMYPSAILLETGILGLFLSLLMRSPLTLLFAAVIAAGLAVFGSHVVRMLARRTTAPVGRLRDDFAGEHIGAAGGWLLMAVISGIALAALPMSEWTIRVALVYGVAGLVGGLAQSVIGFQRRTLPQMAAREWRYAVIFFAWLAGVPLLAGGFVLNAPPVLALGGGVLFAAALLMCADVARMISAPRPRR